MNVKDKIIVITGGGSGIGAAMARRFAEAGAKHIICADRNLEGAQAVAEEVGGTAFHTDVSLGADIVHLIETVEADIGPIDLFVSNAGIGLDGGVEVPDEGWQMIWDINVQAHIRAARVLVPKMLARGGGYIMSTASAAGLLAQIGSAPYSVTKHAAVSFAEWLAITHGAEGLKVSVLCPQGVATPMTAHMDTASVDKDGMLSAEAVAQDVLEAIEEERFLILPHPQVADYMKHKAGDPERWIGGMQRWQAKLTGKA
ncbi:SDR family oxidoreductase [Parasphingorhabdus halotolerans]|uniref:SDR family oxidoreductase n=1 Tax=Parasphingorhabdus halotolerans TaxID=2725558 RepID=A0A6H2DQ20_9SPHN|nr:SDR family oxidoreductase [Parasphingorhabdus halotolerans]QJB69766.1 SDR family oxidoreductase [Parasphingorhabdus halotolerans]